MTETNSIEADEGKLQAMLRTLVNQLIAPELYLLIPTILPRIRCDTVPYPRQTIGDPDVVKVPSTKTAELLVLSDWIARVGAIATVDHRYWFMTCRWRGWRACSREQVSELSYTSAHKRSYLSLISSFRSLLQLHICDTNALPGIY